MEKLVAIGEVAFRLGVGKTTLRLWERKGLLVPVRTPGGHRRYRESEIERIMGKEKDEGD